MINPFLGGILIALSSFWPARFYLIPFPIITAVLSFYFFLFQPFLYFIPTVGLGLELLVLSLHSFNPDVDLIKSVFRIILPLLISIAFLPSMVRMRSKDLEKMFKYFALFTIFIVCIDFAGYIRNPLGILIAPFNPYTLKDLTLLFNDGNWSSFFVANLYCIEKLFSFSGKRKRLFAYALLIYVSGSRSAFLFLLFNLLLDLRKYIPILFFRRLFNSISKFISSYSYLFLFLVLAIPFYIYFVMQGGIALKGSETTVSLSLTDGSLQSKFHILQYSLNIFSIYPHSILIGIGPQVELDFIKLYAGHSLFGITAEIGLLGILPYFIPQFLAIGFCKEAVFPFSTFLLYQAVSFFPLAYSAPLVLWCYVFFYRLKFCPSD